MMVRKALLSTIRAMGNIGSSMDSISTRIAALIEAQGGKDGSSKAENSD